MLELRNYTATSRVNIILNATAEGYELVIREDDFVLIELKISNMDADYVATKLADAEDAGQEEDR